MRNHDNTLYLTTQGTYVARERENLVVRHDGKARARFPVHTLGGVVAFGTVSFSPFALGLCAEQGITVSMLTENGRFLARMEGPVSGNVLLRRAQHRETSDPRRAEGVANAVVAAKIANQRTVVLRAMRDRSEPSSSLAETAHRLSLSLHALKRTGDLESLRGLEGEAARTYFACFDDLIVAQKDNFSFRNRTRRPPMDRVNALLSFLSVLLAHDCRSACECVGLDSQMGFLHRDRPGRPSLALDLVEELRPLLADRLTISLINRKQIAPKGFRITESGAVEMDEKTRKTVLVAWQKRKGDELKHAFLGEKISIGLLPHIQARLLARHLRGDLDAYPAFFWK